MAILKNKENSGMEEIDLVTPPPHHHHHHHHHHPQPIKAFIK